MDGGSAHGAAGVARAVPADQDDLCRGDLACTREIEVGEPFRRRQFDATNLRRLVGRAHDEGEPCPGAIATRTPHVEHARRGRSLEPRADGSARGVRKTNAVGDVPRPGAGHLEEQPVLGMRSGRAERLSRLLGELGAAKGRVHSEAITQMT